MEPACFRAPQGHHQEMVASSGCSEVDTAESYAEVCEAGVEGGRCVEPQKAEKCFAADVLIFVEEQYR